MSEIFSLGAQLQLQRKLSGMGEFDISTELGVQYSIKDIGSEMFREHQDTSKELYDYLKGLQDKPEGNYILRMCEGDDWKAKLKRSAKTLYEKEVTIEEEEPEWIRDVRNHADSMKEKNNQSIDRATSKIITILLKMSETRRKQAQGLWERIMEKFKASWKRAMGLMADAVNAVLNGARNLWKKISNLFAEVSKEFANVWNWLSDLA